MKKLFFTLCAIALAATTVSAQEFKFGHINTNELISLMSERDSAIIHLQAYQTDLEETLQGMQDEAQTKYTDYQRKQATWTPAVREAKEKELNDLSQRLQEFQQNAQQELGELQQRLMTPVVKKAQDAITKIAKEKGLTYVFDLSAGANIYYDDQKSLDLLPLAKTELGIPAEKVAPSQIPAAGTAN